MATINQRLAFIISANADSAVKAFEKTANSADKQMKKASTNIDKVGVSLTKVGARGLAATGALAAVGVKFALAGEKTATANARILQINKSMGLFGDSTEQVTKRLTDLASKTALNIGLDQNIIKETQAKLLTFKNLAKTADVMGGAFDRATMAAIDLAAAGFGEATQNATQLGKALQDPIKGLTALGRSGVTFTEVEKEKIKALVESGKMLEAQNTLLAAVESQVKGTALATANSSDKMREAFAQLSANIGVALLPAFDRITAATSAVAMRVSSIPPATQKMVGSFAAVGVAGLGVVSSLSLVAGQAIKMRTRFVDADGSLNKFGRSAKGASVALGVLAAASVASEVIATLGNYAQKTEDRLNKLTITLGDTGATSKDVATDFAELANQLKESDRSGLGFIALYKQVGKAIRVAGADTDAGRIAIEYLEEAFTQTAKTSSVAAQRIIDALIEQANTLDRASAGYKDNTTLAGRFQKQLDLLTGAQAANNSMTLDGVDASKEQLSIYGQFVSSIPLVKDALKGAGERAKDYAEKQREAASAAEAFKTKIMGSADALKSKLNTALEAASANAKKAREEFDAYAASIAGFVMAGVSIGSAQQQATQNTEELAEANKKVADTFKDLQVARASGDVKEIASATLAWSDATRELAEAQKLPQSFLDVLRVQAGDAKKFGENLLSLKGLGLSEAAFTQIAGAGAEVGNQIASSILSGADPAGKVAEINGLIAGTQEVANMVGASAAATYKQNGVDLANALLAGVSETVAKYQLKLTWKNLKNLKKPIKTVADLTNAFAQDISGQFTLGGLDVPALAEGGIVKPRSGGTMVRLGEAGQSEAVIPLPSKGMGGSVTINVTAGLGADGTQIGRLIVDELQAYQRRVGALPLKVSM